MTTLTKAHKYFSLYIRQKDLDFLGLAQCYTCNQIAPWKELDCGHYIDRRYLAVAFDERNAHPQCHRCNRDLDGNIPSYEKALVRQYGPAILDELHQVKHGQRPDLPSIISKYKHLISQFNTNN